MPRDTASTTADPLPTTPDSSPSGPGARERILDAAETLFATGGVEALSTRAVTQLAGVNLAAVNYHFGSKERMIVSLVQRRLEPINARRLERLEAAVTLARPGTPELEEVVDAFLEPVLTLDVHLPAPQAQRTRMLLGRVMFLPPEVAADLSRESFNHVAARFHAILLEALPGIPSDELYFRMHLALGPLVRVLVCGPSLLPGDRPNPPVDEPDKLRARLRSFICAGLRAPAFVPA